jgi:hypothetical protein
MVKAKETAGAASYYQRKAYTAVHETQITRLEVGVAATFPASATMVSNKAEGGRREASKEFERRVVERKLSSHLQEGASLKGEEEYLESPQKDPAVSDPNPCAPAAPTQTSNSILHYTRKT